MQASEPSGDAANLGWARPPFLYLGAILVGVVLDGLMPLSLGTGTPGRWLGRLLIVTAIALFVAATREFRTAGTPIPGNLPTTTIVASGPYRFSRNPIYVAFSLLQLGFALAGDNLWLVLTLTVAVSIVGAVVIPREEAYLERKFGEQYQAYKSSVRCWV